MRLVVDSNILFTFFWKGSVFRELSSKADISLFSPEYALKEINKYSPEISKKAGLSTKEFKRIREQLALIVEFVPLNEYSSRLKEAESLAKHLPKDIQDKFLDDVDFIALALRLRCPLWSNDKVLKKQKKVNVFTTEELCKLI